MGYSSASEGEIVQDKATRTRQPYSRDSAIDRKSRPRSPISRSSRPRYDNDNNHVNNISNNNSNYNSNYNPSNNNSNSNYNPSNNNNSNYNPSKRRYPDDGYHRRDRNGPGDRHDYPDKRRRPERSRSPARANHHQHQSRPHHTSTGRDKVTEAPAAPVADEEPEAPVDEAKLIEDRRKRREALRAKHRGPAAPLLHQALHVATPSDTDSMVMSPTASRASTPASPSAMSVFNDQELANPINANASSPASNDGPSAADYDPSMDMQEDRLKTDVSASAYDETKEKDRQVVVPTTAAPPQKSTDFDMFAEDDDDDDMFALEPNTDHKKDDGTQAVRIPEAKQLDRSMLDDWDDPEGYYRIILGELLDGRYHVQTNLGKGVFSAVVRALDATTNRTVAIKIIRTQESMYKAGLKEIEILQTLAEADPEDKKHVIRLERYFEHKGHLCMVFENLSINLREVLKKFGRDIGINIKAVRSYAQQMFLGLSLFKKCEILHADLKPDNVLVNESRSQLKIADLGSAMSADDNDITDVLVSRFYRAPEIMLGIKHDYAIDMWSIGCTLFELYTGKICFTGSTNNQMLKGIMECRGKMPNRLLKRSEFWPQHFEPDGTFLSHEIDHMTRREVVRRMNITRTVPAKELKARLFGNSKGLSPADAKELNLFADLLDKCLAVDPVRRITPTDALRHPFINRTVPHNIK